MTVKINIVKIRNSKNTFLRPHSNMPTLFNSFFDLNLKLEAQWDNIRDRNIRIFQICFWAVTSKGLHWREG